MRQLLFWVRRDAESRALAVARDFNAQNVASWPANGGAGPTCLLLVHVPNERVDGLVEAMQGLTEGRLTLQPRGVIALEPPSIEAPQQVIEVTARSPLEITLSGLQSVGSWRAFLSFAAASGAVAWLGLWTDTVFLLTASMLIAPFASPAMNLAIGTARGDARHILRSLKRYAASLAVAIGMALLLSWASRQSVVTSQMTAAANQSAMAVLLPLVAGAAGALSQVQSERSSLVSGAAVGVLVAASLAPPAALIGMACAMGQWDLARVGLFLISLQLLGINLSGAIVFRLYGISPGQSSLPGGKEDWPGELPGHDRMSGGAPRVAALRGARARAADVRTAGDDPHSRDPTRQRGGGTGRSHHPHAARPHRQSAPPRRRGIRDAARRSSLGRAAPPLDRDPSTTPRGLGCGSRPPGGGHGAGGPLRTAGTSRPMTPAFLASPSTSG